jgi:hypothetical protein
MDTISNPLITKIMRADSAGKIRYALMFSSLLVFLDVMAKSTPSFTRAMSSLSQQFINSALTLQSWRTNESVGRGGKDFCAVQTLRKFFQFIRCSSEGEEAGRCHIFREVIRDAREGGECLQFFITKKESETFTDCFTRGC